MSKFRAETSNDTLTLTCYDVIGASYYGGVSAAGIKEALDASSASNITLRVNSPGGDAFEGIAIYNLLKSSGKPITAHVDGLAASAASIVCMAADKICMGKGSMAMIHNAMCLEYGAADDLRKSADVLDQLSDSIADIYAAKTELDKSTIKAYMNAETWFTADEFVTAGFAEDMSDDSVDSEDGAYNEAVKRIVARFKRAPESVTNQTVKPVTELPAGGLRKLHALVEKSNISLYAAKLALRRIK